MGAEAKVSDDGFVVLRYGSFEETKAVLNYGFQNFAVRQVANTMQTFAQYAVAGGENDVVVKVTEDLYTVLPMNYDPELLVFDTMMDATLLQAPIAADDRLGTLKVSYGNIVLGTFDLVAMHSVALDGSVIQDAELLEQESPKPFDVRRMLIRLGMILAGILLVVALVLLIIRIVNNVRKIRMYRRRVRDRRRSR